VGRDGTVIRMRAGDTVWTPAGQEHWHGGAAHNVMCHVAMLEGTDEGDGTPGSSPLTTTSTRPPTPVDCASAADQIRPHIGYGVSEPPTTAECGCHSTLELA
jgi:hypothetical protein